ncbi:lamin tail domain-containing protein [Streptomyces sp. NPDC047028]|uniref:lamin tail domain-containing protein n=1 Tax=Streptomyces sp. NPDC047028 TaxID=3155793 RepID=UPI0033DBAD93
MTAVAAVAAAAMAVTALPAAAAGHPTARPHHSTVRISGVHADSGRGVRALNQEWVAITNDSRRAVNLSGWKLSDRAGHTYTFHHYTLGGHATVRVHTGYGHDTRRDLFQDRRHSVWDSRDTATLRNEHGRFVADISWGHHDRRHH